MKLASENNAKTVLFQRFCAKIVIAMVCACFLVILCCGCQFPYKIDPSGNCLFVRNEDAAKLPEFDSPFTSPGLRPNEPVGVMPTVPATPAPGNQSSIPGVNVTPGTASGIPPSAGTGVTNSGSTRGTLLVPGSGPIVLVTPDEQIALIGSEVILFANYKGDDDYLRIGERIEWSLGGVGHIQTTNSTQCSNILALDFNKDKKVSDRYAVTSTLHYEGNIDRGSADELGKVPHLAGQSWISIQSAEEGTSTVTAFAPTIKDWNRRTSSATVHWVDAEWIYPRQDITKFDEPKIFVTTVKKRSSGMPCQNWRVRYEVMPGGPNAAFGKDRLKVVEIPTDLDGKAAVDLHLLEGNTGVSTVKMTIIRPAGVDGGTKRLELHSATVMNHWSADAPLTLETIAPPPTRWGERSTWIINVMNRSSVAKSGTVTLQLPGHIKLVSSDPQPNSVTPQSEGGDLLTWNSVFPGTTRAQYTLVLQAVTNDPALNSQPFDLILTPRLSMFSSRDSQTSPGQTPPYGGGTTNEPPPTYAPSTPGNGGSYTPPGGGTLGGGGTPSQPPPPQPPSQGHSDPNFFANKLTVQCQPGAMMNVNRASDVAVHITNNANVSFTGWIQVELANGLGFVDETTNSFVPDANGQVEIKKVFSTDMTGRETPISPNETRTVMIKVAPTRAGTGLTITATAIGQAQDTQWYPITGATGVETVSRAQPGL